MPRGKANTDVETVVQDENVKEGSNQSSESLNGAKLNPSESNKSEISEVKPHTEEAKPSTPAPKKSEAKFDESGKSSSPSKSLDAKAIRLTRAIDVFVAPNVYSSSTRLNSSIWITSNVVDKFLEVRYKVDSDIRVGFVLLNQINGHFTDMNTR